MFKKSLGYLVPEDVGDQSQTGLVFNVQRYSIQDGPGIRTTVFFKGCPLKCLWCSNPESQGMSPELLYFDTLCVRCYRCVEACPNRATTVSSDGSIEIDRQLCTACGTCADVCLSGARVVSGRLVTVTELLDIVKKDSLFYRNSGGGVTASGGEPTYQPGFLLDFLKRCQESGLHTCLDTCGYVPWPVLEKVLEYVNLVLFDIKHMESRSHRELTGVDNGLILDNIKRIAGIGKPVIMRVPLIPGFNDSEKNIRSLAQFMTELGLLRVDLLPYHELGVSKYRRLGMEYKFAHVKSYQREQVEEIKAALESYGLEVEIV